MTASTLRNYCLKDLAQLAKRRGVNGWHAMRKDQLVRAILRAKAKSAQTKATKKLTLVARVRPAGPMKDGAASGNGRMRAVTGARLAKKTRIAHKSEQAKIRFSRSKNLAFDQPNGHANGSAKDRLVVMVR